MHWSTDLLSRFCLSLFALAWLQVRNVWDWVITRLNARERGQFSSVQFRFRSPSLVPGISPKNLDFLSADSHNFRVCPCVHAAVLTALQGIQSQTQ